MKEIRIKYSDDELNFLKDKAEKQNKTLEEYQREVSLKAKVKIIIESFKS